MDRPALLSALIKFEMPLADLKAALAELPWEAEPVATLTRADIAAVLQRFLDGRIDTDTLTDWAYLVECREDLRFEPGREDVIADALHDLTDQDLEDDLETVAAELLPRLKR